MQLLDGKSLSETILADIKTKISQSLHPPHLHVILLGDDPSSLKYVALKQKKCLQVGIDFTFHHLPQNTPEDDLLSLINSLNQNPSVTGFFIQLPLPSHLNRRLILDSIDCHKDVDGLSTNSPYLPAVDLGIVALLEKYRINVKGKKVVIINDSDLIGQPLKLTLEKQGADVTLCNRETPNMSSVAAQADILISAAGVKNLITPEHVRESAVVFDVAGGDIDFSAVSPKTSFITPTFGGVGPMTIACLLQNVWHAYASSNEY